MENTILHFTPYVELFKDPIIEIKTSPCIHKSQYTYLSLLELGRFAI